MALLGRTESSPVKKMSNSLAWGALSHSYTDEAAVLTSHVGVGMSLAAVEAFAREARVGHEPGRLANLLGRVAVGVAKDAVVELSVADVVC